MDRRGSIATLRAPGPFRCLPCKRVVVGTESGHCPSCGFVPPSAPVVPPRRARVVSPVVVLLVIAVVVALVVFVTD